MRRFMILILLVGCIMLLISACRKKNTDTLQENPKVQTKLEEDDDPGAVTTAPTASVPKEEVISEETNENLIPGGYFDQLDPKWGTYTESGGVGTIAINESGQLEIMIENTGRVGHAVQIYCDGFELLKMQYMKFPLISALL